MVQISEGDEPVKVPLAYYDQHGERHVVGEAAVQIKDGEVIALGQIQGEVENDKIVREILGGINLEAFSISARPFISVDEQGDEARRRLSPLSLGDRKHVTARNPNGEVRQCTRRALHGPHEWKPTSDAYFEMYCPGISLEKPNV